jgi:phosphatidylglycerophosphate synthase
VLIAGVKEILMAIGGIVIHRVARTDIMPSNLLGKTSTVVFFLVCVALMLFRDIPGGVAIAMISFAIALTLCALASYLKSYVTLMKNRDKAALDR